jgi:hypothetical protein
MARPAAAGEDLLASGGIALSQRWAPKAGGNGCRDESRSK